ncbi:CcmD family protein [Mucilaginibacter myungsuensis]|uniref:CcmD family protein n=1 Tax=Mucilaginibacter myungsuensis TaxID=649104 RepID=A0A929PUM8_9SPHI|nr:CcmD family protein [Mucilaginibacter myungsuensis]MBE9660933.1 CcmD family protein [Mucilaginibacter myungsuensis]MDN3600979.1 CcmD family protein [Mucilaginibacter myungsuensis]
MKKLSSLMLALMLSIAAFAQPSSVEMADTMRSEGKIYVVIATITIVFIGLAIFLFSIDRRVKKLEKSN